MKWIALVLLVAGCQSAQVLMPTPTALEGADPGLFDSAGEPTTDYRVFIFTDREPSGKSEPASFYSNDRSLEGRLAVATVKVGANMDWDQLRKESLSAKRDRQPTLGLVKVEEFGKLWTTVDPKPARYDPEPTADDAAKGPARRFAAAVNADLERSGQDDIFIFVHGFNTKFHENLELAAELHHYLGREGAFVSYAWPSRDALLSYTVDKVNAAYSTRMFRIFLEFLARETDAYRIHILAHSAGSPIAVGAVRDLRFRHPDRDAQKVRRRYRLGQFVLAAPDLDFMLFRNAWLDGFYEVPERVTVYASRSDHALGMSSWIFSDTRLGRSLDILDSKEAGYLAQIPQLEMVSVEAAEKGHGSSLGHSYFHEDPWVSSDLLLLLRYGLGAAQRGLTRKEKEAVWGFPDDYETRVRELAADTQASEARKE